MIADQFAYVVAVMTVGDDQFVQDVAATGLRIATDPRLKTLAKFQAVLGPIDVDLPLFSRYFGIRARH